MARTHQLIIHSIIFSVLALSSLGMGSMLNILRDHPLGLHYQTPAQRLLHQSSTLKVDDGDDEQNMIKNYVRTAKAQNSHPAMRKEIEIVSLEKLREWKQEERAVIFDVRPHLFYQIGHIPSSYSLQIKIFDVDYKTHTKRIDDAMKQGKEIVIYCAGPHCPDASKVAMRLKKMNYRNLSVFEGGWDVWEREGLEQESSL